jgi:hypothetical protein
MELESFIYDERVVGGPAICLMPHYFDDMPQVQTGPVYNGVLQLVNPQATRTTVGCIRNCEFCGVDKIEISFNELTDWPDLPIICDNNLLAASRKHFDRVIDRLKKHEWSDFNQGIDARLLKDYHASRFAELKNPVIRLALDSMEYVDQWEKAFDTLRKAGLPKKSIRSYALIGFDSGPAEAWERCEYITGKGIKVLPQWYHALDQLEHNIVTENQENLGWTDRNRTNIMGWYYKHRGEKGPLR